MENEIGRLTVVLAGQMQDLQTKFSELESSVSGMAGQLDTGFKKVGTSWKDVAGGMIMGGLGIGSIVTAFNTLKAVVVDSVKAYDDEMVAMKQIAVLAGSEAGALEVLVQTRMRATRFTEEEYRAVEKSLLLHKLNGEQIQKIMPVIEHYGALNGNLTGTAQAFGYAIEYGATRGLRQFGIEVDKTGSQAEIFNQLLALGAKNSGNLAEELNTGVVAGGIDVKKAFIEMAEAIGEFINTATPIARIMHLWAEGVLELIGANEKMRFEENKQRWGVEEQLKPLEARRRVLEETLKVQTGMVEKGAVNYSITAEQIKPVVPGLQGTLEGLNLPIGNEIINLKALQAELDETNKKIASIKGGAPSRLATTKPGGADTGAITGALSLEVETIGLYTDKLTLMYKKGEITANQYYLANVHFINEKYAAEKDALKATLALTEKEEDRAKIRASLQVLEVKQTREIIKQKEKLSDDELKIEEDAAKKRKQLTDAEQKELKEKYKLFFQFAQDMGAAIAQVFTAGFAKTGESVAENLKAALKNVIVVLLDFIEKYVLIVKLKLIFDDLIKLSFAGFITGAIKAAIVTSMFEIVKAGVMSLEQGGMIRGARHSGGGVNINAEDGEYMQPRPAVSYYGTQVMEAMRRMLIPREVFSGSYGLAVAAPSGTAQAGGLMREGRGNTIVNFIDPNLFDRYLNSAAGQRAVVNVIRRNQFGINR